MRKGIINKGICALLLVGVAISTIACNKENLKSQTITNVQNEETSETILLPTFPNQYNEEVSNTLAFDARVIVPSNLKENMIYSVTAKLRQFDNERVKNVLLKDIDIVQQETYEDPLKTNRSSSLWSSYEGDGQEVLSLNSRQLFFMKPAWLKVRDTLRLSYKDIGYNGDKYKTGKKFTFGTPEKAYQEICDKLEQLGLDGDWQHQYLSMDYKTMVEEKAIYDETIGSEMNNSQPVHWSNEDDAYYFSFEQTVDNIPVNFIAYSGMGIEGEEETAAIHVLYNKDGIAFMESSMVCDFTKEEKKWNLLPFDDIVQAIKKRYDLTVSNDNVKFTKMKLCYIADYTDEETLQLTPAWICTNITTEPDGYEKYKQVFINAATAEEIIYELH